MRTEVQENALHCDPPSPALRQAHFDRARCNEPSLAQDETALLAGLPYTGLRDAILTHPRWPKASTFLRAAAELAPTGTEVERRAS
jgi:hypothetical protein